MTGATQTRPQGKSMLWVSDISKSLISNRYENKIDKAAYF